MRDWDWGSRQGTGFDQSPTGFRVDQVSNLSAKFNLVDINPNQCFNTAKPRKKIWLKKWDPSLDSHDDIYVPRYVLGIRKIL